MTERTTGDMTGETPDKMNGKPAIEQAEADVAAARVDLADTVDELAARLDVPARAKARMTLLRAEAADVASRPPVRIGAGAVAVLVAVGVGVLLWRRGR